jgi:RNA polymerase sigma-70 factor (ECF subfamily)
LIGAKVTVRLASATPRVVTVAPATGVRMTATQDDTKDRRYAALMRSAQAGDQAAYRALLRELLPVLRSIVRSRQRSLGSADADDLVQDVLLSLHAVRATYDPARPFLPWLMAIARSRLADGARRYYRRVSHEVHVEQLPVTFSGEGANMDAETYGDPEALKDAIAKLPARQREAIEMLKLRDMSLKEAAAASGSSVAALKVSVHRAILSLRNTLKKV